MTLANLRTFITNITTDFQLDNFVAAAPTSTQLTDQINWAIRVFSRHTWCAFDPKITFTVTADVASYSGRSLTVFSKKIIWPQFVTINGVPLCGPDNLHPGMFSFRQLVDRYRTFQTVASGKPVVAAWMPGEKVYLTPPPTAAVLSAGNNFMAAVYEPADLVVGADDANEPDIPAPYHETLGYIAAIKGSMPRATEQAALQALANYDAQANRDMNELRRDNMDRMMGMSGSNRAADSEWLREWVIA